MRYHLAGADGKAVCCVGKLHPDIKNLLTKTTFETIDERKQCKTCRKVLLNGGRISSKFRVHVRNPETNLAVCVKTTDDLLTKSGMTLVTTEEFLAAPVGEQCKLCRKVVNPVVKESLGKVHLLDKQGDLVCGSCAALWSKSLRAVSLDEFKKVPANRQCKTCAYKANVKASYVGVRDLKKKQKHLPGTSGMRGLCGKLTNNVVTHEEFEQTPPNMQCPKCVVQAQSQSQSQEQAQNHDA